MPDKWIDQLQKIKTDMQSKAEVSIIDEDVTGVQGNNSAPDNLFYSEFSEEVAVAFFDIFARFGKIYETNSRDAIDILIDNIEVQIKSMPTEVCPIEVLLYASRTIKQHLSTDYRVYSALKLIVAKQLRTAPIKVSWYILSGWEWKQQLSILIEAIGESNNAELVDLAMQYYQRIADSTLEDDDRSPLKAYLNMLLSTQNIKFIPQIADVVSNPVYMDDNELLEYFVGKCKTTDFLKIEPSFSDLLCELNNRDITKIFRTKLRYLQPREYASNSPFISNMNSNLDQEHKREEITKLQFGQLSNNDLYQCEQVRDRDGCILVCDKVMESIDNIFPDAQRGRAYVLLGTKGKYCRNQVVSFLCDHKRKYPRYILPIDIGLVALEEITSDELFDTLFNVSFEPFWSINIGRYFRYNKKLLSDGLIPFMSRRFSSSLLDEALVSNDLHILNGIIDTFNGTNDKLADQGLSLPEDLIHLLYSLNSQQFHDPSIYNEILELLNLVMRVSHSSKRKILNYLDILRQNLPKKPNMLSVQLRINELIKKGDALSEPN